MKIQIKSVFGKLLFEHELENNTFKNTLTKAVSQGANLRGANLSGANIPMYSTWSFSFNGDRLNIGCKTKTIKEWDKFFKSKEEFETPRNTQEFKQIQAMYEAHKSYYKFLNEN